MEIAIDSLLTQLKSGLLRLPQADGAVIPDFAEFLFAQPIGSSIVESDENIPLVEEVEVEHEAILLELGIPAVVDELPRVSVEVTPEIFDTLVEDSNDLSEQVELALIERTVPVLAKPMPLQSVEHVERTEDEPLSPVSAVVQKQVAEAPALYRRNTDVIPTAEIDEKLTKPELQRLIKERVEVAGVQDSSVDPVEVAAKGVPRGDRENMVPEVVMRKLEFAPSTTLAVFPEGTVGERDLFTITTEVKEAVKDHHKFDTPQAKVIQSERVIVAQISEKLAALGDKSLEIQLAPKELGSVKFTVTTHESGQVSVVINAEREDVVHVMRRHLEEFAKDFEKIGFSQVNFSFSEHSKQDERSQPSGEFPAELDGGEEISESVVAVSVGVDVRM